MLSPHLVGALPGRLHALLPALGEAGHDEEGSGIENT